MAIPFQMPNPYGGYFSFDEVQAASANANLLPNLSQDASPGMASQLGRGNGGFNPTEKQFWANQELMRANAQFMSHVLRRDARGAAFSNMMLNAVFQNNEAARLKFTKTLGGVGNVHEMTSFILSHPAFSGFLGGSHASVGLGALTMGGGGMTIGGRNMWGDGPVQIEAAKQIYNHLNARMYGAGGVANREMTGGLNRDQIGGLMSIAGSQGMLAGLPLGKLSRIDGQASFQMDPGTLEKIEKSVKAAAKSIGTLIDIYGSQDIRELARKANQITGLDFSRPENADIMHSRLKRLVNAAYSTGSTTQTMFDMAAGATQMAMNMGMPQVAAGATGVSAAINGRNAWMRHQASLGGAYISPIAEQEFIAAQVRNDVGMSRDPLGARRAAVELLIQQGAVGQGNVESLRKAMSGFGPSDIGRMDRMILGITGRSLPGFIKDMGGSANVWAELRPGNVENVKMANDVDIRNRQLRLIHKHALSQIGDEAGATHITSLVNALGKGTLEELFAGLEEGLDPSEIKAIIAKDPGSSKQVDKLFASSIYLRKITGDKKPLAGVHNTLRSAMNQDRLLMGFQSHSDRQQEILQNRLIMGDEDVRGYVTSGRIVEGLLDRYTGDDPMSKLVMLKTLLPKSVVGGEDINLNPSNFGGLKTPAQRDAYRKSFQALYRAMSRMPGGREALDRTGLHLGLPLNDTGLAQMAAMMSDPIERHRIFAGFKEITGNNPEGKEYSLFALEKDFDDPNLQASGFAQGLARRMAGRLGRENIFANLFQTIGTQLSNKWTVGFRAGDPVTPAGGSKRLSDDERKHLADTRLRQALSSSLYSLTSDDAKWILSNRKFGQVFTDIISSENQKLMEPVGKEQLRQKERLTEMQQLAEARGFAAGDSAMPGAYVLNGLLKHQEDGSLLFNNVSIRPGKK